MTRLCYSIADDPSSSKEAIQGEIWGNVFMILKELSSVHPFINIEVLRHSEMSILMF